VDLWEYIIASDTLQQVIPPSLVPDESNNVAPHYMRTDESCSPPRRSANRRRTAGRG